MDFCIEFDQGLSEDTPVYRIVDFFAAADMVRHSRLRFSRADMFSDKNEGVDWLLTQLEASTGVEDGLGRGWHDRDSAERYHQELQKSHYIVCWTEIPESVAMWSLYSKDECSVRVKTSLGKIRKALLGLLNKLSKARLTEADIGKTVIVSKSGMISKVRYDSLEILAKKFSRHVKAYERIFERYRRKGLEIPSIGSIPVRYFEREKKRSYFRADDIYPKLPFNLKDVSYQHEQEIRVVANFGEHVCTQRTLDEIEFFEPSHEYHQLTKFSLRLLGNLKVRELQEYEFVDCCEGFIEAVAIDPRCPQHKRRFMESWFVENGVPVEKSSCFGYLPDGFDLYPKR